MVQVKKAAVREAILASAFELFSRNGFHGTTLAQIARDAGVSVATVYVYFKSKLDVVYAIYTPWLQERLAQLKRDIALMRDPRRKRDMWEHVQRLKAHLDPQAGGQPRPVPGELTP